VKREENEVFDLMVVVPVGIMFDGSKKEIRSGRKGKVRVERNVKVKHFITKTPTLEK
jgi:hypothetical protein